MSSLRKSGNERILELFFWKVGGRVGVIFVTGLSGVGKTSALQRLHHEGYYVVDTDNQIMVSQKNRFRRRGGNRMGWRKNLPSHRKKKAHSFNPFRVLFKSREVL
ncbi:RNase adapter RapZ [Halobacillus sp. HZG1]|uniref:RNase adapter RapZ n=1 Tax=Halobacillus sp. HZG1 TaxID=3111769 RepID=UPI003FA35F55